MHLLKLRSSLSSSNPLEIVGPPGYCPVSSYNIAGYGPMREIVLSTTAYNTYLINKWNDGYI